MTVIDVERSRGTREGTGGNGRSGSQGEQNWQDEQTNKQGTGGGQGGGKDGDGKRTAAEWVSLGISLSILTVLVGFIVYQHMSSGNMPATVRTEPRLDSVREAANAFYLPVDIVNVGTNTAADVKVEVTHEPPEGEKQSAEVTIDFLSGGEKHPATFVFQKDPRKGKLTTGAVSFKQP